MGRQARKQELALSALLVEPSLEQAAQRAGVGLRTLNDWLAEPGFKTRYHAARSQILDTTITRLTALATEAADLLAAEMRTAPKPADRIAAAKALLGFVLPRSDQRESMQPDIVGDARVLILCRELELDARRFGLEPRAVTAERPGLTDAADTTENGRD
jgi:hypothetical protein